MPRTPSPAPVLNTPTGRYLYPTDDLPPALRPAFPSPDTPPRCIAAKSRPTEDGIIRLGLYPPIQPLSRPEVEWFLVPADAVIHTSVYQ